MLFVCKNNKFLLTTMNKIIFFKNLFIINDNDASYDLQ